MFLRLITYSLVLLIAAGCTTWPKTFFPSQQKSSARQQHTDSRAQQQYYDQGLQQYSKDNYGEAKASFQQVVDLGPNTTLGLKAKDNLKKIDQILKTLEEIESK
jgi:outer membrane protein assembly factor BamD (BamD/ComL family)